MCLPNTADEEAEAESRPSEEQRRAAEEDWRMQNQVGLSTSPVKEDMHPMDQLVEICSWNIF